MKQNKFVFQLLEGKFSILATATFSEAFIPFMHALLL